VLTGGLRTISRSINAVAKPGDLYESRHPDVFGQYFDSWGDRDQLLKAGADAARRW
jgi:hypothetical protein